MIFVTSWFVELEAVPSTPHPGPPPSGLECKLHNNNFLSVAQDHILTGLHIACYIVSAPQIFVERIHDSLFYR